MMAQKRRLNGREYVHHTATEWGALAALGDVKTTCAEFLKRSAVFWEQDKAAARSAEAAKQKGGAE